MLQKIRDRATGPLAWLIVGIICIPFAFFGIEAFRADSSAGPVAKVGGEEIADAQLQQRYQQRYQQLQQMLGENFRSDLINPDQLRSSVLNGMIQEAVNTQYLADQGYRISDQKVLAYVRGQEAFQENGYFSPTRYQDLLRRQGMNAIQYEDNVRAFLANQQLRQAVSNSAIVTDAELAQTWAFEKQSRKYGYRVYKADAVREGIKIEDADVQALYEERKASLKAPERVTLDYLELDPQQLKAEVEIPDGALQSMYDEYKDTRFTVGEERKARHILVRASQDDAKAAIEDAAERIAAGEDFATVAKEVSQDPGSKAKGGDLGWVSAGMMVKPFEEALFALQQGAVSEPVESQFGWHLIQLEEIRPARVRAFDDADVQTELEDMYRDEKAREMFEQKAEQLEQLSFENPSSLQPAADALGLEIKTSEWITRQGGAGIGANDGVVEAAFSDLVLNAAENSLPITVGRRHIVIRLNEHEEERPQTLDEVRSDLVAELTRQAVADKLRTLAEADKAELETGKSMAELADTKVAQNQSVVISERTEMVPNRALVTAAFDMPRPQDGSSSVAISGLSGSQDLALIELMQVTDGDWSKAQGAEKDSVEQRLRALRANQEYAALEAALREQADVKIYDKSAL